MLSKRRYDTAQPFALAYITVSNRIDSTGNQMGAPSDVAAMMTGLQTQGRNDFEDIELFRDDPVRSCGRPAPCQEGGHPIGRRP
jgi:hypothetical protein